MPEKWEFPLIIRRGEDKIVLNDVLEAMTLLDKIPRDSRGYLHGMAVRRCEAYRQGFATEKSCQLAVQAALAEVGMFPPRT